MTETLRQRAYDHILKQLANGELPSGTRLSNRALASQIGISVIPVREAIGQLQSEGLVAYQAGIGSFVPEPSYDEVFDIYDLREAIECHAIRRVGALLDSETLDDLGRQVQIMADTFQRLQSLSSGPRDPQLLERWSQADARFHDLIVQASGNLRALETLRNLRKSSRIYGARIGHKPLSTILRAAEEHRHILDALEAGDAEQAARLLSEHIRDGCREFLENHHRTRLSTTQK